MGLSELQITERKLGIGSSDSAAVLGCDRWRTPIDVWGEKTGLYPHSTSDNPILRRGVRLEKVVAEMFTEETGFALEEREEAFVHPDIPFILAHPDRILRDAILECKVLGFKSDEWGTPENLKIPKYYWYQCQHEMLASGFKLCYLAALFVGSWEFIIYEIPRDPNFLDTVFPTYREFWRCVQQKERPEFDPNHPKALEAIRRFHSDVNNNRITLPNAARLEHFRIVEAKAMAEEAKKQEDTAKATLLDMMGNYSVGELPDGSCYERRLIKSDKRKPYVTLRYKPNEEKDTEDAI